MDADGQLMSSGNEQCVESGEIDPMLKKRVMERTEDQFQWKKGHQNVWVCVRQSALNGWLTVAEIPMTSVTGEIDSLYHKIFGTVSVCMLFCCGMLLYMYYSFINPINELNTAMMKVYSGDLNAYVKVNAGYEIADMMHYFNDMLRSINVHVIEKLESDRKKKELELDVLMSQINPHFLYNTLENIVWKSNAAGHPDIGRMAAALGRMYRLSISSGQSIVPMQQEIEHIMAYVKIQKNRYEDAFELDLRTDADTVRKYYVLKILLQPVVENSFLYGMEGLEHKMLIRVAMSVKAEHIEIGIVDNGIGMDREKLEKVRNQIRFGKSAEETEENRRSTGIGLHNVSERIKLYFGTAEPIKIYSKKGMGTMTVITLPRLTEADVGRDGELKGS